MSFVARKNTRSSSSHKNIHYKNLDVPGALKKYISDSPGKTDFHSVNSSDST